MTMLVTYKLLHHHCYDDNIQLNQFRSFSDKLFPYQVDCRWTMFVSFVIAFEVTFMMIYSHLYSTFMSPETTKLTVSNCAIASAFIPPKIIQAINSKLIAEHTCMPIKQTNFSLHFNQCLRINFHLRSSRNHSISPLKLFTSLNRN